MIQKSKQQKQIQPYNIIKKIYISHIPLTEQYYQHMFSHVQI